MAIDHSVCFFVVVVVVMMVAVVVVVVHRTNSIRLSHNQCPCLQLNWSSVTALKSLCPLHLTIGCSHLLQDQKQSQHRYFSVLLPLLELPSSWKRDPLFRMLPIMPEDPRLPSGTDRATRTAVGQNIRLQWEQTNVGQWLVSGENRAC